MAVAKVVGRVVATGWLVLAGCPAGDDSGEPTSMTSGPAAGSNDDGGSDDDGDGGGTDSVDGGGDGGSTSGAETGGPSDDGPATGDDGPAPTACDGASLFSPGVHTAITVDVDGVSRSYDLFVPTSYDPTSLNPLVVNFHGLLGSPGGQMTFSQFNNSAEEHGMLVAYPAGIGSSFNAGVCCGEASSSNVDDVGFARKLVQDVSAKMCVDPKRVHATGMSNGGHMAHRLACEAADVFASTASVAGVLSLVAPCVPSRPVSIIQFHGTSDNIVSYNGIPAVPAMMQGWAARNGCSATSEITFAAGDTHCETWPGCDDGVEVTLCTTEGGGHCWPGVSPCPFGDSTTQLHASDEIADMFDEQPMP